MRELIGCAVGVVVLAGCKLCFEPVCETVDGAGSGDGSSDEPTFVSGRRIGGAWGLAVNLTAEGSLDWRHWGRGGVTGRNQKAGVTSRISDLTQVGGGTLIAGNGTFGDTDPVAWTDGMPTAAVTADTDYVMIDTAGPQGDGWELTVGGEDAIRTLTVYVANWCVRGRFEAALDDGGAPPYIDATWEIGGQRSEIARYVIEFRSATSSTLRVRFTVDQNFCMTGDLGEIKLQAATLR